MGEVVHELLQEQRREACAGVLVGGQQLLQECVEACARLREVWMQWARQAGEWWLLECQGLLEEGLQ